MNVPPDRLKRNCNLVIEPIKTIFHLVPKCGMTSIKASIWKSLGGQITTHPKKGKKVPAYLVNRKPYNDLLDVQHPSMHYATPDEIDIKYKDYFKVMFVRNPWSRMVSLWFDKTQQTLWPFYADWYGFDQNVSFENFLRTICKYPDEKTEIHAASQHVTAFHNNNFLPNYVGKIENFKDHWNELSLKFREQYNFNLHPLEHWRKYPHKPYKEYYTSELIKLIEKRYKKDIELFKYEY